jgi:HK97 family phage portal protein
MGLASWLGYKPAAPAALVQTSHKPLYDLIPHGMSLDEYLKSSVLSKPIEVLWREQPHLRTVVGFISRNIAQLGLHVFERDVVDDGRNRQRTTPLARLLNEPNDDTTTFELIEATCASRCLYDETYWYVAQDNNARSGWTIRHIPTPWIIGTVGQGAFAVEYYKVAIPGTPTGHWVEISSDDMIVFRGWNPRDPTTGVSPVHSLKAVLAEQIHAQVFRDQMWQRGGRVGSFIVRPPPGTGAGTAPQWSPEARDKWVKQYAESYSGDGERAGGTPLFEDGMELKSNRFSAKDEQFVEASKLSLSTCAQVYFINPTMVGLLENANYSNVREFRKALYGDNLGPEIERIQQRINRKLVPRLADPDTTYVEFNLQTKLAGSFEEQSDLLTKAIGGPYMTRNEGRSRLNMPSIDGGDELIVPLNVTANGDQNPTPAAAPDGTSTLPTLPTTKPEGGKQNGAERNDRGIHVQV